MNNFTNPIYNPYRVYYPNTPIYSYGYPQIHFEHIETFDRTSSEQVEIKSFNTENNQEQNSWNSTNQVEHRKSSGYNFNDIISLDNDRVSILGFSINIDDLIILITLFTMFKQGGEIDYILVIVLGLLLFSQD